MLNVLFKYSIAISLVILYLDLLPSHSCNIDTTEVLQMYATILKKRLNFAEEIVKVNYSNCCKSDEAARPELNHQCNILMETITGSNCTEARHISKHKNNCSKSKEYLKELCDLNCYLEKQTKKMIEGELKSQLDHVINPTFQHLCCRRNKKRNKNHKGRSRPCIPVNICELKKTIYELKSKWEQFAEKAPSQCRSGT